MKNFKRSLALVLALVMIVGTFASVSAFTLTNQQAWFADAVYDLQNWGVITESDVESAMAQKTIDRKTFTLWVAKILSQDVDGKIWEKGVETRYEDVNYDDANDDNSYAIAYATANGIVRGYNEGPNYQFGPDDALKLGQGAVIVIRLLSRFGDQGLYYSTTYLKNVQSFKDTFDTTEYAAYMWWAQQIKVIDETYKANCTSFADGAALTYGEAAYLLWNAASNCETSAEFDDTTTDNPGTIAEKFNSLNINVNRTYYGIVTNVEQNLSNGKTTDEVKSLSIQVQTSSKTYVTMTFANTTACKAELPTRSTDNQGKTNTYTSSSKGTASNYVSVRDFTVGTMVKISYNGNAYNDATNGVITYTKADAKLLKVEKLEANTVKVDTFLVYKYGYTGYQGWLYNHLYNELPATNTAAQTKLNYTPVLASYYDEILTIKKSTETRKNTSNADTTVYKINFLEENYVLGTIDPATGKVMLGTGLVASASDKVLVVCDNTGTEVTVGNIATVYADILNIAEGQMKFTFADTDGDGDFDILTQNKASVAFKTIGTKLDASGKEVPDYTTAGLKTDATGADANDLESNFLFNYTVLRKNEKVADEKLVNTEKVPYSTLKAANNGLTMLLMNPSEATPYYRQVQLLDDSMNAFKTVTGMVTNVETLGGIANYYKMTITAADGTATEVTIPAYSALVNASGATIAINKTFNYKVGESSSKVTVDTNTAGWYNYLTTGYQEQYTTGANAQLFPATEANKPVWLLQRTVTVAVDVNNNVLTMSGYDLLNSATKAEGFVTKVQAGANANQFKVTLAGSNGMATVDVIASLSGAYDDPTLALINKIFYQKVIAGNEAVIYGVNYVATPSNVLYVQVKNDTNNYIVSSLWNHNWKAAEINGDITNRIFDAATTYGAAYTNQTAIKVPTVAVPEVVNYYNAYTATNYKWVVNAYPTYDTNGTLISTKYAYVKTPEKIEQVQYAQTSKLAVDFTKSYTLQVVYDGTTFATGTTKVVAPFDVYSTTVNPVTGVYDRILTPTYAQIYAYQTHKYVDANGVLDTTMGYGYFYADTDVNADGILEVGNLNQGVTLTRYYVDANNTVYTIVDYKGLVYQTKADGTYVVVTEDAVTVGTPVDVTTAALAGQIRDLSTSYIASALPSNTEYKAHAKDEGYKYVPGWYRFDVLTDNALNPVLNVKDDTVIVIATPDDSGTVASLDKLNYTYTETTFGALRSANKELAVSAYDYYLDPAKGYVTYLVVFGAYATAGKNSDVTVEPSEPDEVVVDTTKAIVYLPNSSLTTAYVKTGDDIYYVESSFQAINVATGAKVGTLKYYYSTWNYGADYVHQASNNVTIPAGHFYLIDLENNAILEDLGAVWTTTTVERGDVGPNGKYNRYYYNDGKSSRPLVASGGSWTDRTIHNWDSKTYTVSDMNNKNYTFSSALLAEGTELGYFGKMSITDVTPDKIVATVGSNANVDITNLKYRFVYFDYAGDTLTEATKQSVAVDMPVSGLDIIYAAEGYTVDEFGYYFTRVFTNNYYGKTADVQAVAQDELYQQTPATYYADAVKSYNSALATGKSAADIDKAFAKVEKAKALLAEFEAEFAAVQNDIFWTTDIVNSKLYQHKIAQITAGEAVTYPTFTYYYDYATATYTVFVTSFEA